MLFAQEKTASVLPLGSTCHMLCVRYVCSIHGYMYAVLCMHLCIQRSVCMRACMLIMWYLVNNFLLLLKTLNTLITCILLCCALFTSFNITC